jgi:hypothetical protein
LFLDVQVILLTSHELYPETTPLVDTVSLCSTAVALT